MDDRQWTIARDNQGSGRHAKAEHLRNPKVSLETARKIAGHISIRMTRHYFHGDLGDMKHAVDALRKVPHGLKFAPLSEATVPDCTVFGLGLVRQSIYDRK